MRVHVPLLPLLFGGGEHDVRTGKLMNKAHLMNDPFLTGIIFHIESHIHDADRVAGAAGVELKDSHIKSSLSKVKTLAKGRLPKAEPKTERARFIIELALDIDKLRTQMRKSGDPDCDFNDGTPISTVDWLFAVKVVEDSLKHHTLSGTRHYLDFLTDFMAKARDSSPQDDENSRPKWWRRLFGPAR
jgi:hypothetical protein